MAPHSTASSNPGVSPQASPEVTLARRPAHYLLLAFRWAMLNNWVLYGFATLLVGGSLLLSIQTDAWHWFQRSGALLVSIGALLSTRRALELMLDAMINGNRLMPSGAGKARGESAAGELRTCVCGFLLVAMGTFIWAYGDLLGCLLQWESACLP